MSYPTGRDYGDEDSKALVPGTLTVFRHFLVDTARQIIAPMSWSPSRAAADAAISASYGGWINPAQQPYRRDVVHVADCSRRNRGTGSIEARFGGGEITKPHDKSPTEWCTCGFYAHYDHETDFYPSYRWGQQYARVSGASEYENLVVVRAVVEVSGTVVMGRLGVRAEKMKIVALAVDWGKQVRPQPEYRVVPDALDYLTGPPRFSRFSYGDLLFDSSTGVAYFDEATEEEENARTEERVQMLASSYGVKHYADVGKMYEDHPPADISALGVDTTPRPEPKLDYGKFAIQFSRQASAYMQATTNAFQGVQATRGWLDELFSTPKQTRRPKPSVPQSVQDVIDAKASRPAPPGVGIDRRKGRLR